MVTIREGADVTLSAIQKKMLPVITLPMPMDYPTSLRYALAKYDAGAVSDAWDGLRELEAAGLLVEAEPKA